MPSIKFCCRDTLSLAPEEIARRMLDLANWPAFTGYGPLPGIKSAEFELRTPDVVGTRIRVFNADGSTHVEQIIEWQPERRLQLRMLDFSPPLSRLATHIDETWDFKRIGEATEVARCLELQPKSAWAWPVLRLIAPLLKGAIARHLRVMGSA